MRRIAIGGTLLLMVLATLGAGGPATEPVPIEARITAVTRGVLGGKHDFGGTGESPGDACRACHVPHIQAVRPSTQPTTRPTTRPTLDFFRIPGQRRVFVPGRYTPGPTSLACLGCHDGTVATSTITGAHVMLAGVRGGFQPPEGFVWRDHPIGIPYPSYRRDYRPESYVTKTGKIRLPEGRIECISCHDPHNEAGVKGLLVMSNRRSALCLTCHVK
jgi:predicted CXXCH cytochrome family protein